MKEDRDGTTPQQLRAQILAIAPIERGQPFSPKFDIPRRGTSIDSKRAILLDISGSPQFDNFASPVEEGGLSDLIDFGEQRQVLKGGDRHGLGELMGEPEKTGWSAGAKEKEKEELGLEGFTGDMRQALPGKASRSGWLDGTPENAKTKVEERPQQKQHHQQQQQRQQGKLVRQDTESEEFEDFVDAEEG
jgi:hypothetical protein